MTKISFEFAARIVLLIKRWRRRSSRRRSRKKILRKAFSCDPPEMRINQTASPDDGSDDNENLCRECHLYEAVEIFLHCPQNHQDKLFCSECVMKVWSCPHCYPH